MCTLGLKQKHCRIEVVVKSYFSTCSHLIFLLQFDDVAGARKVSQFLRVTSVIVHLPVTNANEECVLCTPEGHLSATRSLGEGDFK